MVTNRIFLIVILGISQMATGRVIMKKSGIKFPLSKQQTTLNQGTNQRNYDSHMTINRQQRSLSSTGNSSDTNKEQPNLNESSTDIPIMPLIFTLKLATFKFVLTAPPHPVFTAPPLQAHANCLPRPPYSCGNKCSDTTYFPRFSSFSVSQQFKHKCSCDSACNSIFMDCCNDFQTTCSYNVSDVAEDIVAYKQSWRCVNELAIAIEGCEGNYFAWMIHGCPNTWPDDDIRHKCYGATSQPGAYSYSAFIPVVGLHDQLTYRNQYCARCNNVSNFGFWNLIYNNDAVPPPTYSVQDLLEFFSKNTPHFTGVRPQENQKIRWCHYPNVIGNCSDGLHHKKDACLNGSVALVTRNKKVFKNQACSLCNGNVFACPLGPERNGHGCSLGFGSISRAISLRDYGLSTEQTCPLHQVYDPYLYKCRQSYQWSNLELGVRDAYKVTLWFLKRFSNIYVPDGESFKEDLAAYFAMNESQITIDDMVIFPEKFILTFKMHLSLSQSLIMATDSDFQGNSNETVGLRSIFKFKQDFEIPISNYVFTVYKLQVRQINCTRRRLYISGEYTFLDDLRIYVNSTGTIYEENEYFMNSTVPNATVSVCLKLPVLTCNGSFIKLNQSEYSFSANLSLVYRSLVYNIGDYIYKNDTAFICVEFKKNYSTYNEEKDHLALVVVTWVGFVISIICLVALLVTYFIFQELRTLPGKNLISLSISLCFAEILWLCGSLVEENNIGCTVIAIVDHYFFLVFFTATSVVAFHSCLVFGKKINFRRGNSEKNKIFLFYSLVAWGIPAIFVLIFSLLDHYEIFIVDYGYSKTCWLGTKQSKIFLFILPFGILILFNIFMFAFVVVRLYKNQKSSAKSLENMAKKRQKQNILVCIKLSTLMGFAWVFGLLQISVETKTVVFSYLFVLFVGFQGIFISVAFLFKRTNYVLYSSLLSFKYGSSQESGDRNSRSKKTLSNAQDTKL